MLFSEDDRVIFVIPEIGDTIYIMGVKLRVLGVTMNPHSMCLSVRNSLDEDKTLFLYDRYYRFVEKDSVE